jgi:hypothetical protein
MLRVHRLRAPVLSQEHAEGPHEASRGREAVQLPGNECFKAKYLNDVSNLSIF